MYDSPEVTIVSDDLEAQICVGSIQNRELKIAGSHDYVKGIVYSDNPRVVLEKDSFFGVDSVLHYTVNASGLEAGELLEGHFDIVSNAGECSASFAFRITSVTIDSSIGPIHDLFHFANLVQASPDEACHVFARPDFEKIFIKDDMATAAIYRVLHKGSNVRMSIEEFLIAIRKKQPVRLKAVDENGAECSDDVIHYGQIDADYKDTIILHKNTWGYVDVPVICDAPFVTADHQNVTSEDFAGNTFELGYIIRKDRLHAGRNYAKITVGTGENAVVRRIEVIRNNEAEADGANQAAQQSTRSQDHIIKLETAVGITQLYIDFRTHRIDVREWAEQSTKLLERAMSQFAHDPLYKLMQAQIYCVEERDEDAEWLLEAVREDVLADTSSIEYCYFLYVNSVHRRNESYTSEVHDILKKKYDYNSADWRILWMLFYLDKDYEHNQSIKLARIKELYHAGCHSPIMYLEACTIINSQPVFLRIFDEFERQVINFGCKYNIITEKAAKHICDIGQSERSVSKTYLRILQELYDRYGSDDILTVLCEHLIRNQMRGSRYFGIYETCILHELRITRLYESYMDSIDSGYDRLLPKVVLMYFSYNNQLNDTQKAFLYANIINYLPDTDPIKLTYAPQMEQFAAEQLRLGQISNNLVILYKYIWNDALINEETAVPVARLLFAYKLTCSDSSVKNAIVLHKELNEEVVVPFIDNVACVSIYTEKCCIAFEYEDGSRKCKSVDYELERLMNIPDSVESVYSLIPDDIFLSVYYYEQNRKYHRTGIDAPGLREKLLDSSKVTEAFEKEILDALIEYYHDRYTGDEFADKAAVLAGRKLTEQQSAYFIEMCVANALYIQAYDTALAYGTRKVSPKRLYRLCRHMLEYGLEAGSPFLTQICWQSFKEKKYDAPMLTYLQNTYNGTCSQMLSLWDACRGFDTECYELEERITAQMIFVRSTSPRLKEVFAEYYEQGAKERVIEAYIGYEAYGCFMQNREADEKIFRIIESRLEYDDNVNDLARLALLKHYSRLELPDDGQKERIMKLLGYFCTRDIMFPFFLDFADKVLLPYKLADKTIVEYRCNPDSRVTIHYKQNNRDDSEDGTDYTSEIMQDAFMGIFVKTFTIFQGGSIKYYITQELNGEKTDTEPQLLTCRQADVGYSHSRYEYLNDMLKADEAHDTASVERIMHEYCVEDYITKELFKPKY